MSIYPYDIYSLDNAPVIPIPSMYWNVVSPEQRIKRMCREICKLSSYAAYLGIELDDTQTELEALKRAYEEFETGGFVDKYLEQIEAWINENMERLFSEAAKMVFFGLTLDGHFVAYIPDSWADIDFDTGMVYGTETYGRLILRYDVDSTHDVDQEV